MSLIYSRPRIKLPKIFMMNSYKPIKNKNRLRLLLILFVFFISYCIITRAVVPVFNKLCSDKAKGMATIITNEETTNTIKNFKYSDFIIVHKDDQGNVLMLESNMKNINYVISDVANRIQMSIDNIQPQDVTISLGTFTGISILSGRGYRVPIRISTIGNVKTNVKSEFIAKGINQTLHRLYLEIECEISILTPFNTIQESIFNQLILAENVIVGNIPSTYYNIEGISSSQALDLVE